MCGALNLSWLLNFMNHLILVDSNILFLLMSCLLVQLARYTEAAPLTRPLPGTYVINDHKGLLGMGQTNRDS